MQTKEYLESVRTLTKMILTSPQKLIREKDLQNLCSEFNFDDIISDIYKNLKNLGFELVKSKFLDQNYYILTTEGKDDIISPAQYGVLALILAFSKELDENLRISDLQEIFKDIWNSDIKFLIENDYLREMEDLGILKITPLGKAIFKEILPELKLGSLIDILKSSE